MKTPSDPKEKLKIKMNFPQSFKMTWFFVWVERRNCVGRFQHSRELVLSTSWSCFYPEWLSNPQPGS